MRQGAAAVLARLEHCPRAGLKSEVQADPPPRRRTETTCLQHEDEFGRLTTSAIENASVTSSFTVLPSSVTTHVVPS